MHAENNSVLPSYFMGFVVILISIVSEPLLAVLGVVIIWTASVAAIIEGCRMSAQRIKLLDSVEKEKEQEQSSGVSA